MSPVLLIVAYLVIVTAAGAVLARRTASSRDWAVAGGGMGLAMIAVGVAGTRIGGGGTYGVAGNVISGGVWNMWWYGITTFLAMAIVGLFFARPYRRLGLQTVGEIFTVRFGRRRNQTVTSLCVQIEYFIVNLIEAYVIAVVLKGVTADTAYPVSMGLGVLIAAFILVTYIALGGLWGTAVTNMIHCLVIIVGLASVGVIGTNQFGGWGAVTEAVNGHIAASDKDYSGFWQFTGGGLGVVFGMFFSAAVHTPAASVYTNYATAARNERILLPAFLVAGLLGGLMPILAGVIGILTIAQYGLETGTAGYTNLTRVATELSPFMGTVAIAAVLAAVISSGGPILLSSATMFVRDWLPFAAHYSPKAKLKAYRITTLIYGLVAAFCAWWVSEIPGLSVLDLLLFGFAMVVPPAIAVGYLIYWRRTTEWGALAGMISGLAAGLLWFLAVKWAGHVDYTIADDASAFQRLLHFCFVNNGKGLDASYATTFVPLLVIPVVSWFTSETEKGREHFYHVVSGGHGPLPDP